MNQPSAQQSDLFRRLLQQDTKGLETGTSSLSKGSETNSTGRDDRITERQERQQGDTGSGSQDSERQGNQSRDDVSSLFSMAFDSMLQASQTTAVSSTSMQDVQAALQEIVDRILVSAPDIATGSQQVTLTLSQSALADTQILLSRLPDGMLDVVLKTTNASSYQTLVAAQAELQARLEANQRDAVRVTATKESMEAGNENESNPQQRSRGLDFLSYYNQ